MSLGDAEKVCSWKQHWIETVSPDWFFAFHVSHSDMLQIKSSSESKKTD